MTSSEKILSSEQRLRKYGIKVETMKEIDLTRIMKIKTYLEILKQLIKKDSSISIMEKQEVHNGLFFRLKDIELIYFDPFEGPLT